MNELKFQHIGIQVENIVLVTEFYKNIFEMKIILSKKSKYYKGLENLQIVFLKNGNFIVELIEYKSKNSIENKSHVALVVIDLLVFIEKLEDNNIEYSKFIKNDGSIDFITFNDPEFNSFEILQKLD